MNIDKLAAQASKLSIPQLQQAMRDGTLPPYVGLPILQQKSQLAKQAQAAQAAGQPRPPTVAQQVDGEASQAQSVQDMMKQRALAMQGEMAGTGGLGSFVREPEKKMALGGAVAFSGENYSYVDPTIIKKYLTEAARKYNLNPDQLIAQANAESSLNPMATNPNSTAAGMGQFTEGTWKDWGTSNPNDRFNPKLAAEAMAKYNRANIDKWGGDLQKGYASYHLGPNADPEKLANDTAYTSKILGQNAPDGLSVPQLTYSQPTKLTDYASQMEISPAGNPEEERAAIEKYLGPNKGIESLRNEISKMKEESAADKDKSLGMALMQAGLATMAGPSQYALVNVGAGFMKGLEAYTDSLKDYKKEQNRLVELQARADDADRQEAWNKFKYGEESAKAKTATHRADVLAKQTAQQKTEADQAKLDIDAFQAQTLANYYGKDTSSTLTAKLADAYQRGDTKAADALAKAIETSNARIGGSGSLTSDMRWYKTLQADLAAEEKKKPKYGYDPINNPAHKDIEAKIRDIRNKMAGILNNSSYMAEIVDVMGTPGGQTTLPPASGVQSFNDGFGAVQKH